MKTKILSCGAALALALLSSCSSNESAPATTTVTTAAITVDAKIDASVDDVANIVEDQYTVQQGLTNKSTGTIKSMLPLCATITTVLTNGTWTRTIDFGTQGCALPNGNTVKGKITISFVNNFTSLSQTITYTLDGFYHNDKKIEGTKTIIRTLKSSDLLVAVHPISTCTLDLTITFADGKVYKRTGTRVKEMTEGFDTKSNWEDNVFLVWGTGNTTFPDGSVYTATIKTPLRFVMTCHLPFPVLGSVSITKNQSEAVIDFGTGICDNLATVTILAVTKEITLEK
ncbi:hypothetical protein [Flavobacterium restrictum]|uniref:Lipoprotein n=1 Tax=Flavobacterium restrictum TaxID=2594428 RepID=A0A553E8X6_9FLAO|nr:hypothetical protein [Flavobacterium restrictum]TRX41528.1 hypothetical protein FNW21_05390 [Flavobacterium restrictum]